MNKFYLGMNYNNGGIQLAKKLVAELTKSTNHKCTSRWIWSEAHESHEFILTIGITDIIDIALADYVLLAPLSATARGCHVEMGIALALDKPTYLYRPKEIDNVGFDGLCKPWKQDWINIIEKLIGDIQK